MRKGRHGGELTALAAAEAFDVVRLWPELASFRLVHCAATLHALLRGACSQHNTTGKSPWCTPPLQHGTGRPFSTALGSADNQICRCSFIQGTIQGQLLTFVLGWSYGGHRRACWAFSPATSALWLLDRVRGVLLDQLLVPVPGEGQLKRIQHCVQLPCSLSVVT